jgi:hypothetical protein
MAKIRFEGLSINVAVIEVDGIENPMALLEGLGSVLPDALQREGGKVLAGSPEDHPLPDTKDEMEDAYTQGAEVEMEDAPPVIVESSKSFTPSIDVPDGVPSPAVIEAVQAEAQAASVAATEFKGAKRLRDVVQVFMDAGIDDTDAIVGQCLDLKDSVAILKRVTDIEGRMPIAVKKWRESNQ